MADRELNSAARSAVVQEAIFRPRNAAIIGATIIGSFAMPALAPFIAAGGAAALAGSVGLTYASDGTKNRALEFVLGNGLRPGDISEYTTEEVKNILDAYLNSIKGKLSDDILKRVVSIRNSLNEIFPHIQDINSASSDIYVVRQTAIKYLPETLDNYLQLSPRLAKERKLNNGKTAHATLLEQLDILDQELKDTIVDIHNKDSKALLAHGRFLKSKFEKSSLSLS
ncbi:MAG: hypothetical protein AAF902_24190 [Chloroflexota bacterium]